MQADSKPSSLSLPKTLHCKQHWLTLTKLDGAKLQTRTCCESLKPCTPAKPFTVTYSGNSNPLNLKPDKSESHRPFFACLDPRRFDDRYHSESTAGGSVWLGTIRVVPPTANIKYQSSSIQAFESEIARTTRAWFANINSVDEHCKPRHRNGNAGEHFAGILRRYRGAPRLGPADLNANRMNHLCILWHLLVAASSTVP